MSTVPFVGESPREAKGRPPSIIALAILLGLLVIGSLQGGLAMVADPRGPLGLTVQDLGNAPVDDYLLPGLFLLGIASASALAITGLMFRWDWRWAAGIESKIGFRWPWVASVAIGGILLAFEVVELFFVPYHPVMHPLLIAGSLAILALAMTPSARRFLESSGSEVATRTVA